MPRQRDILYNFCTPIVALRAKAAVNPRRMRDASVSRGVPPACPHVDTGCNVSCTCPYVLYVSVRLLFRCSGVEQCNGCKRGPDILKAFFEAHGQPKEPGRSTSPPHGVLKSYASRVRGFTCARALARCVQLSSASIRSRRLVSLNLLRTGRRTRARPLPPGAHSRAST